MQALGQSFDRLLPRRWRYALTALMAVVLLAGAGQSPARDARTYTLATASSGGTYYPVGAALSTLIRVKLQPTENITMSAVHSAGSGENIGLLQRGEAQFAILQGLYGYLARNGAGPYAGQAPDTGLRAVTALWPDVEHIIVRKAFARTGTVADLEVLKGERISMGRRGSGALGSNRLILAALGLDIQADFQLVYLGYASSAEALQSGRLAAMSTPAGVPAAAVAQVLARAGDDVTLLAFTDEQLARIDDGKGLWSRYVVPAGTYPGVDTDYRSIAQPNFLAVREAMDEEVVYLITRTVYENLPFLRNIHPAAGALRLDQAMTGLPVPLHPGAVRYFREQGLVIPDHLLP